MIQHVSHIEKEVLFKTVIQNEHPVRFHGVSCAGIGVITVFDRTKLSIILSEDNDSMVFSLFEPITAYFDCHGKTYAFETKVRETKQRFLQLEPPTHVLKSLQRKYVRIKHPRNIAVKFHLTNEEICLDYPECSEYVSVEKIDSSFQTDLELSNLIKTFRDLITDKCAGNTIQMFRTKKPESFEEELVSKTGKVLFVPSTSSSLPKNDPYPEGRIITESLEETFEDPNYFIHGSKFEKILKEKNAQGISSEIWCPIVYYQYVVGYIYVYHTGSGSFDTSMLDYVWDFSRVLAYRLKETGYFDLELQTHEPLRHVPKILDISPGGMLISVPKNEIRMPIKEGSFFSVEIQTDDATYFCSAKVVRRYVEKEGTSYGTTFTGFSPEQVMHLYETLYRRKYAKNDMHAHESK